jgi:hypothetical protein
MESMKQHRPAEEETLPMGADPQSLVRSAIAALVRAQRTTPLSRWQFEAALFLLGDALDLGLYEEAVRLGECLLEQEPGNERVCEGIREARSASSNMANAIKLLHEVYA